LGSKFLIRGNDMEYHARKEVIISLKVEGTAFREGKLYQE
jgi:hypothetical protein